jgi:CHASE2 domain-containing sensor protein
VTPEDAAGRHERVGQIFLEALDLPVTQREPFLVAACGGDTEMLRELKSLLATTADTFRLFDHQPGEFAPGPWVKQCPRCGRCYEAAALPDEPRVCPEDAAELQPGFPGRALVDGKYRIEARLGQGGMGAVYRARHIGLDRYFAVKLITGMAREDPGFLAMFAAEAKALGQLKHPNIIDVTDYGVDTQGLAYLVMELLEGRTLEDCAPLPHGEAVAATVTVARALQFVHEHGLIHRDLKPNNVLVSKDGVLKLIDFGLVAVKATGIGTPGYMAPELRRGEPATVATEVFALGMTARRLLGEGMPAEVDRAVKAMIEPEPSHRPPSMALAAEQLESAWLRVRQREWRQREIPRRVRWAALLAPAAVLIGLAAGNTRVTQSLEARTVDARMGGAPRLAPDPRILLVSLDEASLAANPQPLALRGDEFGTTLGKVLDAGAARLGIDLLLPEAWGNAPEFSRFVLRHAPNLTLSLYSGENGATVGTECLNPLTAAALGPEKLNALFAFVNLEQDSDGAVRQARSGFRDQRGEQRPAWANAVAVRGGPDLFWLGAVDRSRFERIAWKDLPGALERNPQRLRGRLVLFGAEYLGSGDTHRTATEAEVSGLEVQAITAATILAGYPIRAVGTGAFWAALILPAIAIFGRWWMLPVLGVAWVATAWLAFRSQGWVLPVIWPLAAMAAAQVVGLVFRKFEPPYPVFSHVVVKR